MPPNIYAFLADLILVLHIAFALFNALGFVAIWVGFLFKRQFVHNRWFRGIHVATMGIVALESVMGWFCPLTTWEYELRRMAGQGQGEYQSFMSYWAEQLFYHELSETFFLILYISFFACIVATFIVIPVRWRKSGQPHGDRHGRS